MHCTALEYLIDGVRPPTSFWRGRRPAKMLLHCSCSCSDADAPTEVKKGGDPAPASACGSSWVRKSRETHILRASPSFHARPTPTVCECAPSMRCLLSLLYYSDSDAGPSSLFHVVGLLGQSQSAPAGLSNAPDTGTRTRLGSAVPVFFLKNKRLGSVLGYSKFLLQTNKQTNKGTTKKKYTALECGLVVLHAW
jgi:hypothetical protein